MKNKRRKIRNLLKILTGIILSLVLLISLFIAFVYFGVFGPLPGGKELAGISNEEASLVYSSEGELIGKYFAKNRSNVSWEDMPLHLTNALIATEDKRYFSHEGIDSRSLFRVFFKSILLGDRSAGGGSTISQQLIKNLYGREDHSFFSLPVNKLKEAIIASRLEDIYSKQDILVLYLNSVPFGEEVYGVESAARRYFNKSTAELRVEESAVLVGMLKANTFYNPRLHPENARSRRNQVLKLMQSENYLSGGEADSLQQLPLKLDYANFNLNAPAGYFLHQVRKKTADILQKLSIETGKNYDLEKDGLRIHTSLNLQMQNLARAAVRNHLSKMQKLLNRELDKRRARRHWEQGFTEKERSDYRSESKTELFTWDSITAIKISRLDSLWHYYKMLHAAVLITDPASGRILVWIGGNHFRYLPFDMVLSHRQIASAFKPMLYTAALEEDISPCTYLQNEEKEFEAYDNWKPNNFDFKSTPDSSVAFWYALARSMNLPTIDLYFKLGSKELENTCRKLGIAVPSPMVPSHALGTLDVSLYEIVRAYAAFANKGMIQDDLRMIEKITGANGEIIYSNPENEPRRAISERSSEQITAILQQAINRGTGTRMRTQFGIRTDLAGKTGTAQNYRDAWFINYTPDLVCGVWVGASSPQMHFNSALGAGSSLALPIAGEIISNLEKSGQLRRKYLTDFTISPEVYHLMDCPPYRQKGIKGFFKRLFGGKKDEKAPGEITDKPGGKAGKPKEKKERSRVGKFLDKLFKGKKDKKKDKKDP